ncbi:MAG: cytochrome c [Planctomycetes bacterium]|nr:cytochrome c [Planctomycetota bacterium]MCB9868659.1 cytochrome c [Planctomycetota bacterium]
MFSPHSRSLLLIGTLLMGCANPARTTPEDPATRAASRAVAVPAPLAELGGTAYEAAGRISLAPTKPDHHEDLHNVYSLSSAIVSGGEPHTEEAFRRLQKMGIHTILSVDGKVPDAAMAAKYGMRYVHVPIQYKGITEQERLKIAKTFRDQQGPFYVHCFHGQHRGPAAAAIGRLVLDGIPRQQAIAEMRRCGTSKSYEGLYQVIACGEIPSAGRTEAFRWDFPSASPLEGVAGAMVRIARAHDHLKAARKHGWLRDPGHPDLNSLNEVAVLQGLFDQATKLDEVRGKPADFQQWMLKGHEQAVALQAAVQALSGGRGSTAAVADAFRNLEGTCSKCHKKYRN